MTDDMPITHLGVDEAMEAIRRAPYLAPILQAILKDDVHVLQISQGIEPFNIPSAGRPWILWLHDDPADHATLGPDGFDKKSLEIATQAATLAVVIACEPIAELYAKVANEAAVKHNNAILVDTWLAHDDAWCKFIKAVDEDIHLAVGTARSSRA